MKLLEIYIEKQGKQIKVGSITGRDFSDACFSYSIEYLTRKGNKPISVSLPLKPEPFTPYETRTFFEGLLPEGFTRRSVASYLHANEEDYLSIVSGLGNECLGALLILDSIEALDDSSLETIKPLYIKVSLDEVKKLASEGASVAADIVTKSHLSLAGASGKVGLYYDEESNTWYQPLGTAPSTHIVKQSHVRLEGIVVNEALCLLTAKNMGLDVADNFILNLGNANDDEILFVSRRYDRIIDKDSDVISNLKKPFRLHQEDFAQALGIPSNFKYEKKGEHYLKEMFSLLSRESINPIEDQSKLWDSLIFNFLIGNADNHIKNYSLIYDKKISNIRLAPIYDVISTICYPSSTTSMSVNVGGTYDINEIDSNAFIRCANEVGINQKLALGRLKDLRATFETALRNANEELLDNGLNLSNKFANLILERFNAIKDK